MYVTFASTMYLFLVFTFLELSRISILKITCLHYDNSQKIIDLTKQFITTSPTFAFDGIVDSLEIKIISADTYESKYFLEGKFKTLHTGYGDRTNLELSKDITLHIIEISVVDGQIISAVIDNQWDELNQITCNTASC